MHRLLPPAAALLLVLACLPARADLALAKARNCMACHNVERKIVGPSFKAIAKKYAGQNVNDRLAQKIVKGGSGVWGPVPMPANSQVSDADAKALAAWITELK
ncbi:c-type cytochrome [Xylophilus sp. Leaf220]|uniref:c-type cytochrome n=1 Tax=Xylophilus sp. Leaf220 TaxID=1735686 RepID=UPI0006F31DC5|nr:c-type cytochrome [Xylophilus sp. Leaf220]KQM80085.1 cytochrome C' [Xylophilus sp. Leaf220]